MKLQKRLSPNHLVCCLATAVLMGCSNSATDSARNSSENQDSTPASTEVAVEQESQPIVSEPEPKEVVISDNLADSPQKYTVDGKTITVVKGSTSEADLQKKLGDPYISLASSYTYVWEQDSVEYHTKFYLKSGIVTGVKESMYK